MISGQVVPGTTLTPAALKALLQAKADAIADSRKDRFERTKPLSDRLERVLDRTKPLSDRLERALDRTKPATPGRGMLSDTALAAILARKAKDKGVTLTPGALAALLERRKDKGKAKPYGAKSPSYGTSKKKHPKGATPYWEKSPSYGMTAEERRKAQWEAKQAAKFARMVRKGGRGRGKRRIKATAGAGPKGPPSYTKAIHDALRGGRRARPRVRMLTAGAAQAKGGGPKAPWVTQQQIALMDWADSIDAANPPAGVSPKQAGMVKQWAANLRKSILGAKRGFMGRRGSTTMDYELGIVLGHPMTNKEALQIIEALRPASVVPRESPRGSGNVRMQVYGGVLDKDLAIQRLKAAGFTDLIDPDPGWFKGATDAATTMLWWVLGFMVLAAIIAIAV